MHRRFFGLLVAIVLLSSSALQYYPTASISSDSGQSFLNQPMIPQAVAKASISPVLERIIGDFATVISFPGGVFVDHLGMVFATDTFNDRIQKFAPNGTVLAKYGGRCVIQTALGCVDPDGIGPLQLGDGQFNQPDGVAVMATGQIVVADTGNNRIQLLDALGRYVSKFGAYGSADGQFNGPEAVATDPSNNIIVADALNNRIQKFDRFGHFLKSFGTFCQMPDGPTCIDPDGPGPLKKGDGQFNQPPGVATDSSGRIYVADRGNNRIQVFSSDGSYLFKWGGFGSDPGKFSKPYGIAVDRSNKVYTTDQLNNRTQVFDSSGNWLLGFGTFGLGDGQFNGAKGLAVDESGLIYVADTNSHRIQIFDPTGTFIHKIQVGAAGDEFNSPEHEAIDGLGNVFIADGGNHRIEKLDNLGNSLMEFGSYCNLSDSTGCIDPDGPGGPLETGDGQFNDPGGVALDASGNVYVADTLNNRIQKFDGSGNFLMKFGSEGTVNGTFREPTGLDVDSSGKIYVVDSLNHRVEKFNANGVFLTAWGGLGSSPGKFNNPQDVVVDPEGNVVVVDFLNHRVEKFTSSGVFILSIGSLGSKQGQLINPFGVTTDSTGTIYVAQRDGHRVDVFDKNGIWLWRLEVDASLKDVVLDFQGNMFLSDTRNSHVLRYSTRLPVAQAGTNRIVEVGVPAVFNGSLSADPDGTISSYLWIFGDGGTSDQAVAAHTYTIPGIFTASLTVTDNDGNSDSDSVQVNVGGMAPVFTVGTRCVMATGEGCVDPDGEGPLALGDGQFNSPHGIAYDTISQTVFVADTNNSRIQVFDSAGNFLYKFGTLGSNNTQFKFPYGVAVYGGRVYVADTGNHRVTVFNSTGGFLFKIGGFGTAPGQMKNPRGVYIGSAGSIYVADTFNHRVEIFNASGSFVRSFGSFCKASPTAPCDGKFYQPSSVISLTNGNLVVADTDNNRIQIFDAQGNFLRKFGQAGSTDGRFLNPSGVASTTSDSIYVVDTGNNRIQVFSSAGSFLSKFGVTGSNPAQFMLPFGICLDPSQDIYIADAGNHRIQRLTSTSPNLPPVADAGPGLKAKVGEAVRLDGSGSFDRDGFIVSYEWDLGDGTKDSGSVVTHAYNSTGIYTVTLTVTDNDGDFGVDTTLVTVEGATLPLSFVLKFGVFGNATGRFKNPASVAVDSVGRIIVADTGNNRTQVFDSSGRFLFSFGSFCQISSGRGCVDPDGAGPLQLGDGQFNQPNGIAIDSSDRIYVADTGNHRIEVFDSKGGFLYKFGNQCKVTPTVGCDGKFNSPYGIAIDSSGNIWIADTLNNRIEGFDSSGNFFKKFGQQGNSTGRFKQPRALTVDTAGRILVADTLNNRVQVFDSSGVFLFAFGGLGTQQGLLNSPRGISTDADRNIFIADSMNNRIQKFDPNGHFLMSFGSYCKIGTGQNCTDPDGLGPLKLGDGQFNQPAGVTVHAHGWIYVADTLNHRVQVFSTESPNLPPIAEAGPPWIVGVGDEVFFDGSASYDPDGTIVGYLWQFGDGKSAEGAVVSHKFSSPSVYTATLTVTDDKGATGADSVLVTVQAGTLKFLRKFGSLCKISTGEPPCYDPDGSGPLQLGDGQFNDPRGIAVDSTGRVVVLDTYNNRVQVLDSAGNFLFKFGTFCNLQLPKKPGCIDPDKSGPLQLGDGQFYTQKGLAIDSLDHIIVADSLNHRIQVFDSAGNFLFKFGSYCKISTGEGCIDPDGSGPLQLGDGQFYAPKGVVVDGMGRIIVLETFNNRVQIFDSSGNFIMKFGRIGNLPGQFIDPRGIAMDSKNNIYIADSNNNRIQVFDSAGNFLFKFGTFCNIQTRAGCKDPDKSGPLQLGDGQFSNPRGVVVDPSGNLYVSDWGNSRIQKFAIQWLPPPAMNGTPTFLFKYGSLCFLSTGAGCVDPDGPGPLQLGDGQFRGPHGITIDANGYIYVVDANNRAQKFAPVGKAPVARAGEDIVTQEGTVVTFDGSGSNDTEGPIMSYQWDFGDGFNGTGRTVNHAYLDEGNYTVTLVVVDNSGQTGVDTLLVTVENVAPSVEAGTDISTIVGQSVVINATYLDPGVVDTHTITWEFDDGTASTGILTPEHTYNATGIYNATLTVVDDDGGVGTDSLLVTVSASGPTGPAASAPQTGAFDTATTEGSASGTRATGFDIQSLPVSFYGLSYRFAKCVV